MIGGAAAPNVTVLYVFRLIQGFGLGALLVVLFAAFTEYVPGKNRGVWSSRNSFIGNFAHPICNGIALVIVSTGVSMNMNWRIQYIIPSVLSIIASIIIYNKYPESPRWLESQGRVEEADAIMTSIEKEIEGFVETGFDQELKAHEDVYKNMWENADIQITGDDELNRAVRFNIFHLMSTGNEHDDHVNVGAKLLTGEEYGGHAFWDTELFMLPFFSWVFPKTAQNLENYRYHLLDAARANAHKNGYKGAQYPWESADDGTEQCPDWTIEPDGTCYRCYVAVYEHHVTAAVAYGIYNYVKITQDMDFLYSKGAEILTETARFLGKPL